jgi:predicted ATPase/tRNA A-37 threonylcarbamoyl transferase component Bud32
VSGKSQTSRVGELVYEAQHAGVKRRFAVKFLRADLADRRDLLARFHREAQAAGALESENIAAAIDFGILADGTPYIVMEHLIGESLGSLLAREGYLPVARAVDLCLQACRGMQAAHAAGIVHRDLKPENLFLCRREDGTDLVKVLDFGIAKLEQSELNSAATRTGTILGTPAYMSPEQARGDKSIDHRTDVYGLAAILFEMLSGKPPHPGDSHNAILHHIATQPAVSLHSAQPDLPASLADTVERALSCNRDQRHASVEELRLALEPFAKREAWPPPKSADSRSGTDAASATPGGSEQYEGGRPVLALGLGPTPSRGMETNTVAGSLTVVQSRFPLVGRAEEIAILRRKLTAAAAGHSGEVVQVVGDAGIGKSRLLEELAVLVRREGGQVLYGRAFASEMVRPYGAWLDALRSGGGVMPSAQEFLPVLPEHDILRAQVGESDRNPMFERFVGVLTTLARQGGPLLVLLDDIQWLDEASAALLHFVARVLVGQPVLLVCAARGGELSDNPSVLRLVRALERDHRLHQVVLSPLGAADISKLVAMVSRDIDAGAVFEGSEGNPLFAIEIARAHKIGEKGFSQTLRALIDERLDRLDEKAQGLLPFAAAMGRSFDPQILARVLDMPLADLFSALGDLERRGVFRVSGPGSYDFFHDMIRHAAYHQLSEPRRRLVHLQLARVLSNWPDPNGELTSDLAYHAALGGDSEMAAHAYLAAANRCLRLFAWGEASELCRRGIQQLPHLDRSTRLHLEIELLGVEVMGKPSVERAREIELELLRALTEAEESGLHKDAMRGYYLRSVVQFRSENVGGAAETSWRAVTAGRSADALTAAHSQAKAGTCLVLLEREIGKAKDLLEGAQVVLLNEQEDLMLNWGLGLLKRFMGEPEEATRLLRLSAALARRIDSHWDETECLRALTILALEQGDFASARALCPLLLELSAKMGEGSERPIAEALDSLARVLDGDATAEEALEDALGRVRDADAKAMLSSVLNFSADNDLTRGHFKRAEDRATEALEAAQAVERNNQAAIARATLARLSIRAADPNGAHSHLNPLRAELAVPFALSAHARNAVERALREIEGLFEEEAKPPLRNKQLVANSAALGPCLQVRNMHAQGQGDDGQ